MWDKIATAVSALIGGLIGTALTLATVGWAEAEKLAEINRAKAYAEFVQAAWGEDRLKFDRKMSTIVVHGTPEVISTLSTWVQMHCNDSKRDREADCQLAWAKVIDAMREDTGLKPAETQQIIDAIYEK